MSLAIRVIPCLDIADGRVVKGVNFKNLRDAGDPVEMAGHYYREGADELTFLDVNATIENRATMYDLVSQVAEEVFIPLTVGGGIRSVADVDQLLKAGADKVSVGSAAIADPNLLRLISERFGSQVLVLSIDAKRSYTTPSGYVVTTHGGRKDTSLDGLDWLETCAKLGVGEVLLNSIDADGVRSGFDTRMLEDFRSRCPVPLIASGGAGSANDFAAAAISGADAVLAASVFHEGSLSINQAKVALEEAGFAVRRSHGTGSVL